MFVFAIMDHKLKFDHLYESVFDVYTRALGIAERCILAAVRELGSDH